MNGNGQHTTDLPVLPLTEKVFQHKGRTVTIYSRGMHGANSPFAYVYYDVGNLTHLVPVLGGLEFEEACSLLAEKVERRHPGHGKLAYEAAREQLSTKDFNAEWALLQQQIREHKMWGGPPPTVVLLPDDIDGRTWYAGIKGPDGKPVFYKTRKKVVEDIIPPATDKTAWKGPYGWEVKRKED